MKHNANELTPGDVFHPGEIVKEEMEARGIKQVDIIAGSGFSKTFISLFLKGERSINVKLALALETILSIKAEFWIRLQKQYEMNKELIELKQKRLASLTQARTKVSGFLISCNVHTFQSIIVRFLFYY